MLAFSVSYNSDEAWIISFSSCSTKLDLFEFFEMLAVPKNLPPGFDFIEEVFPLRDRMLGCVKMPRLPGKANLVLSKF